MTFKTLCCLLAILVCGHCFAQPSLQAYGSYVRNLNPDYRATTYGGGLRLEFVREDASLTKYVGVAYNKAMIITEEWEARAFSSATEPSYVLVTARYSQPMWRAELGGNYYLAGEGINFEGFNWYLGGGLEVIYIQNKPAYSPYDKDLYSLGFTDDSDVNPDGTEKSGLNLHLALGTGVEMTLGPGNLTLQGSVALPMLSSGQTSSDIESFVPLPLTINLGYKIPLFGR